MGEVGTLCSPCLFYKIWGTLIYFTLLHFFLHVSVQCAYSFPPLMAYFINTSVGLNNNGPFLRSQVATSRGSCPDSSALSTQTQSIQSQIRSTYRTVAEYIDPWLGDKVNSGIGLSYRSASHVCSPARRYDNTMPELTLSLSHGSMNSATGSKEWEQRGAGNGANVQYLVSDRGDRG